MAETWPSTVPWSALVSSYQDEIQDNKASFAPDIGPEIERRRATMDTDIVSFSLPPITEAQLLALKTFYKTTLKSGVLTFDNLHPAYTSDATSYEWKFIEPPSIGAASNSLYNVSVKVRKMP